MNKYYTDLNFAGAFTGQNNLKRTLKGKVTKKQFKNFLESNRTYTLFRPRRSKFKRLKTIPLGYMTDLQVCFSQN